MTRALLALTLAGIATVAIDAQWLKVPTAGIPRTPDGRPNLSAPVPRTPDGRPLLGGLWKPQPARVIGNITAGLAPGQTVPFQPWAAAIYQERVANLAKDDPTSNCIVGGVPRSDFVPYPLKIFETPGITLVLYEAIHSYRQIFTDGRALPRDPSPAWFGYSVGRWEGDAFVVTSAGFNDHVWLDNAGHPAIGRRYRCVRVVRRGETARRVWRGQLR
jgi:hypothetical protein